MDSYYSMLSSQNNLEQSNYTTLTKIYEQYLEKYDLTLSLSSAGHAQEAASNDIITQDGRNVKYI